MCIYATRVKTSKNIYANYAASRLKAASRKRGRVHPLLTHFASSMPILPLTFPPLHIPPSPPRDTFRPLDNCCCTSASIITALRFVVVPRMCSLYACMQKILYMYVLSRVFPCSFDVYIYTYVGVRDMYRLIFVNFTSTRHQLAIKHP